MELRFNATEIGCVEDEGALVCGASNSKADDPYHYIAIQGCSDPEDEDDDGVHFEIDDQINGNYDLLDTCRVSRRQITSICFAMCHGTLAYVALSSAVALHP